MTLSANWETKNVLAKNLRAGDRVSLREVWHPIKRIVIDGNDVEAAFGGRLAGWATLFRARESVRIRRKKPSLDAERGER